MDLLRATAIALVVLYHAAQFWSVRIPTLQRIAELGQFGVELFFVLSGWLIGGLYWRERRERGAVDLKRFWYRRWWRTVPPYLAGLALAYLAVWVARREPFDLGYLFFIQNYYDRLPFFVVSWSLCVEEQFYLALPVLLLVALRMRALSLLFVIAIVGPIVLRFVHPPPSPDGPFGLYKTHLRCDGLALGVLCSYLHAHRASVWARVQSASRFLAIPALVVFLSMAFWSPSWFYSLGYSHVALTWALVLASVAGRPPVALASSRVVFCVALWSYSLYLTHTLALQVAVRVSARVVGMPAAGHVAVWAGFVLIAGWVFYRAVEVPSIRLRERWVPKAV